MTETPELLPCPLCGSDANYAAEEGVWHLVRCTNRKCELQSGIFPTKPWAIRIWNTRVPPSTVGVEAHKLVPLIPTARMIEVGCDNNPTQWNEGTPDGFAADVANDIYVSMVRASPTIASETEGGKAGEWRDIASAPRDGTKFLGITKSGRMKVDWLDVTLSTSQFAHERGDNGYTHWQPLPAPPAASLIAKGEGK
jgi:hypothetical protein